MKRTSKHIANASTNRKPSKLAKVKDDVNTATVIPLPVFLVIVEHVVDRMYKDYIINNKCRFTLPSIQKMLGFKSIYDGTLVGATNATNQQSKGTPNAKQKNNDDIVTMYQNLNDFMEREYEEEKRMKTEENGGQATFQLDDSDVASDDEINVNDKEIAADTNTDLLFMFDSEANLNVKKKLYINVFQHVIFELHRSNYGFAFNVELLKFYLTNYHLFLDENTFLSSNEDAAASTTAAVAPNATPPTTTTTTPTSTTSNNTLSKTKTLASCLLSEFYKLPAKFGETLSKFPEYRDMFFFVYKNKMSIPSDLYKPVQLPKLQQLILPFSEYNPNETRTVYNKVPLQEKNVSSSLRLLYLTPYIALTFDINYNNGKVFESTPVNLEHEKEVQMFMCKLFGDGTLAPLSDDYTKNTNTYVWLLMLKYKVIDVLATNLNKPDVFDIHAPYYKRIEQLENLNSIKTNGGAAAAALLPNNNNTCATTNILPLDDNAQKIPTKENKMPFFMIPDDILNYPIYKYDLPNLYGLAVGIDKKCNLLLAFKSSSSELYTYTCRTTTTVTNSTFYQLATAIPSCTKTTLDTYFITLPDERVLTIDNIKLGGGGGGGDVSDATDNAITMFSDPFCVIASINKNRGFTWTTHLADLDIVSTEADYDILSAKEPSHNAPAAGTMGNSGGGANAAAATKNAAAMMAAFKGPLLVGLSSIAKKLDMSEDTLYMHFDTSVLDMLGLLKAAATTTIANTNSTEGNQQPLQMTG